MAMMGYREYSRHAGVTLRAVQKAIEAGHIRITTDKKIDPNQADRDWRDSKDVQRVAVSIFPAKAPATSAQGSNENRANVAAPPQLEGDDDEPDPAESEGESSTNEYRTHRAQREKFSALKQELEYKQLAGELIPVEEAKRIAFTTFRGIRDSVLNVPTRLKDQLAALDDPHQCERLLESALSAALAGIDVGKLLQEQDE